MVQNRLRTDGVDEEKYDCSEIKCLSHIFAAYKNDQSPLNETLNAGELIMDSL